MMKKSSLGRRSSATARKTSEIGERSKSSIPVFSRSHSSASLVTPSCSMTVVRRRDLSSDRVTMSSKRDPSADRMSEYNAFNTPGSSTSALMQRPVRSMTMSSGRPSSISGRKGDDRPLTDREWQTLAIELICNLMNQELSGSQILQSYKSMKPMSIAMFVDMSNYLVQKLDPKLGVNKVNYLTELPYIFKKLSYRGKVDKALLQTVNTMHNWPHVLGMLHFLAELVQAKEAFAANELDPLFPNSIGCEPLADDELNMKLLIPLLHNLWAQSKRNKESDVDSIMEENMLQIKEVITESGFNEDIFIEERKLADEVNVLTMQCDELDVECNKVEEEYAAISEKLAARRAKADSEERELAELRTRYQKELDSTTQLENEIKYLEEECKVHQGILDQYESCGDGELSQDTYESYQKKKKELKDNIAFEKDIVSELKDSIFNEECVIVDLKRECEKLFKSYNSKVTEIMKHDDSIKGALCYTRPKLGVTPCNEATSVLLERILESHRAQLAELESHFKDSEDVSFELSEEVKKKAAELQHLKILHESSVAEYEERKAQLEKELEETLKKNSELESEIVGTKESLKKNHEEYEQLNNEFIRKEEKLRKYYAVCQRKLELRFEAVKINVQKFQNLVDEEEQWKQQICRKLQILVNDNIIPKGLADKIQQRMDSLNEDDHENKDE